MRKVIADHGESMMVRGDAQGLLEFRQAIARYLARSRNIYVDADQIIIHRWCGISLLINYCHAWQISYLWR